MDTLLKADIFFFITSVAVILVAAAMLIVLYYMIRAAQEFRDLVRKLYREVETITKNIGDAKDAITSRAKVLTRFMEVVTSSAFLRDVFRGQKKKSKAHDDEDDE
jgi:hypothetical protein